MKLWKGIGVGVSVFITLSLACGVAFEAYVELGKDLDEAMTEAHLEYFHKTPDDLSQEIFNNSIRQIREIGGLLRTIKALNSQELVFEKELSNKDKDSKTIALSTIHNTEKELNSTLSLLGDMQVEIVRENINNRNFNRKAYFEEAIRHVKLGTWIVLGFAMVAFRREFREAFKRTEPDRLRLWNWLKNLWPCLQILENKYNDLDRKFINLWARLMGKASRFPRRKPEQDHGIRSKSKASEHPESPAL